MPKLRLGKEKIFLRKFGLDVFVKISVRIFEDLMSLDGNSYSSNWTTKK